MAGSGRHLHLDKSPESLKENDFSILLDHPRYSLDLLDWYKSTNTDAWVTTPVLHPLKQARIT